MTQQHYSEMVDMRNRLGPRGFEILAFPSNTFNQEPGATADIVRFVDATFPGRQFPIFDKIDVNGPNTAPLYVWLKSQKKSLGLTVTKWNFESYLISREGKVVRRYGPTTSPLALEADVLRLLDEPVPPGAGAAGEAMKSNL